MPKTRLTESEIELRRFALVQAVDLHRNRDDIDYGEAASTVVETAELFVAFVNGEDLTD